MCASAIVSAMREVSGGSKLTIGNAVNAANRAAKNLTDSITKALPDDIPDSDADAFVRLALWIEIYLYGAVVAAQNESKHLSVPSALKKRLKDLQLVVKRDKAFEKNAPHSVRNQQGQVVLVDSFGKSDGNRYAAINIVLWNLFRDVEALSEGWKTVIENRKEVRQEFKRKVSALGQAKQGDITRSQSWNISSASVREFALEKSW